jgi:hypothetical protein
MADVWKYSSVMICVLINGLIILIKEPIAELFHTTGEKFHIGALYKYHAIESILYCLIME